MRGWARVLDMRRLLGAAALALALPLLTTTATTAASARGPSGPHRLVWQEHDTPSTESLRGLDAVDTRTAWVAGDDGGVWRTTDGGRSWRDASPTTAQPLAYRDVEAFSRRRAAVLAIGEGNASRILLTHDGGRTWRTTFVNHDPAAFYDCMDFFAGGRRGLAMSDPVDGRFRILATHDGGRSWRVLPSAGMPRADGEFGFAASGTCLETAGHRDAWIGSGGGAARIYHSRDGGRTWRATTSTIPASAAGGVFSLAFRDRHHGVAVGGDFTKEDLGVDASARTRDGVRWVGGGDLGGYRSGADWARLSRHGRHVWHAARLVVAVGPSGSDVSRTQGRTWRTFSDTGFHAVVCVRQHTCWASGTDGRVATLRTP